MNRIIITGNLTNDIEVISIITECKTVPKGIFSVAVNRGGNAKQECDYFRCECLGTIADTHAKNLHTGSRVLVEGEMHIDRDKNENTKIYPKIIVSKVEYL